MSSRPPQSMCCLPMERWNFSTLHQILSQQCLTVQRRQACYGLFAPKGCKEQPTALLSATWLPKIMCCLHREVVEKVHSLKAQLSDTQTELASLQQQYSLSEKRLVRASKLISALGDEAGRWSMSADTLTTSLQLLIGRSLTRGLHVPLCACVIT